MFLKINSLKLENIRCFTDKKFKFDDGVNVITGPNGSGKSTIITSIGFGLYGNDYLKGSGLNLADMIKRGEEVGKVVLNFSTNNGNFTSDYLIRITGSDIWKLYQSGRPDPIAEGITETRTVIQSLLGDKIDHNTFKTALCSRQGELTKLLEDTPKDRSDQIKSILGLDNFGRAEAALHTYTKQKAKKRESLEENLKIFEKMQIDKEELEEQIEENNQNLKFARDQKTELDKEVETLKKGVETQASISQKINVLTKDVEKLSKEINSKQTDLKQEKAEITNYEKELDTSNLNSDKANDLLQEANEKLSSFKLTRQQLEQKIKTFNETTKDISNLQQQLIDEGKIHEKNKERMNELQEQGTIQVLEEELSKVQATISNYNEKKENLVRRKNEINQRIENTDKQINNKTKQIQSTVDDFQEAFGTSHDKRSQLQENFQNKKVNLEKKEKQLTNEINKIQDKISKIDGRITGIENTMRLIQNQDIEHDCPVCQRSLEGLDKEQLLKTQQELKEDFIDEKQDEEKELKPKNDEKDGLQEKLRNIEDKINSLQNFEPKIENMKAKKDEVSQHQNEISELNHQINQVKSELEELEKSNPEKLHEKSKELKSTIDELRKLDQKVKTYIKVREKSETQIESLKSKIEGVDKSELDQELVKVNTQIKTLEKKTQLLTNKVLKILQKAEKLRNEIDQLSKDKESKSSDLEKLNEDFDEQEFKELQKLRDRKIEASGQFKKEIEGYQEKDDELKEKMEKAIQQENERNQIKNELDEIDTILPLANTLKTVLRDAPEKLIAKTSSQISSYLTTMIKRLLPDQGFDKAKFEHDGDIIIFNDGKPVDKKTLSGGERTILALTLRMALADYVAPLQFLTLDEPTNHLDANRVNEFIEIIDREQLFSQSKGQLLMVTHREEFNRNAQNSIILDFEDGNRQLIEIE